MASNYVKKACMDTTCLNFDRTKDNNCSAINDVEACKRMGCRRTQPYKLITYTGKVIYRR